jgi:hypothetical protein
VWNTQIVWPQVEQLSSEDTLGSLNPTAKEKICEKT